MFRHMFVVLALFSLICIASALPQQSQQQVVVTTYFPSPYGTYRVLKLSPANITDVPVCNSTERGSMIFHDTENIPYYCNGSEWIPLSRYWYSKGEDIGGAFDKIYAIQSGSVEFSGMIAVGDPHGLGYPSDSASCLRQTICPLCPLPDKNKCTNDPAYFPYRVDWTYTQWLAQREGGFNPSCAQRITFDKPFPTITGSRYPVVILTVQDDTDSSQAVACRVLDVNETSFSYDCFSNGTARWGAKRVNWVAYLVRGY